MIYYAHTMGYQRVYHGRIYSKIYETSDNTDKHNICTHNVQMNGVFKDEIYLYFGMKQEEMFDESCILILLLLRLMK